VAEPIAAPPTDVDPRRNPSYPQRVHIRERAHWQSVLASWDQKIADARGRVAASPDAERIYVQMAGARDQIADAVRRLPMEVGDMYGEDRHRLEEAVAALERLMAKVGA
jgi:hypothetical protein